MRIGKSIVLEKGNEEINLKRGLIADGGETQGRKNGRRGEGVLRTRRRRSEEREEK